MKTHDPLYLRHRFPVEVIANAVWLYFHFPLSLRMVEDMLAMRGIVDAELQRLQAKAAALQTARSAYARALSELLGQSSVN